MKNKFPLSYYILAITVFCFLLQNLSSLLFGYDYLLLYGAKINEFILQGEVWRFITPVLLHGSIIHIGFNMYALFMIGPGLERKYGTWSFLALYLIGGLFGNIFSFLMSANASLGASTAIFGLIAAQGVYIYQNRLLLGRAAQPMLMNIAMVVAINLLLGLSPGIDNWGHLGGLFGGLLYAWFAGPSYDLQTNALFGNTVVKQARKPLMVSLAAVAIAAILIIIGFLLK
jgi:rhomboid protease GluP